MDDRSSGDFNWEEVRWHDGCEARVQKFARLLGVRSLMDALGGTPCHHIGWGQQSQETVKEESGSWTLKFTFLEISHLDLEMKKNKGRIQLKQLNGRVSLIFFVLEYDP